MKTDIRLIAASSRLREGNGFSIPQARTIRIPPLRDRKEDIEPLAIHFVKRFSDELCKDVKGIEKEALSILVDYPWPGNVRELRDVIERAVLITEKDHIGKDEIILPVGKT